jgi:hypothetical protein
MRIPDLFIVGAPKAGTTSLHDWLGQHPDIFMCPTKEPHFFCRDFHEQSDALHGMRRYFKHRTEDDYLALYADRGNEKVAGEAATSSLYSKVAAGEIQRFNPDARIVVLLREPTSLVYSFHSYLLSYAEEDIESFREAIESEPRRRAGDPECLPKLVRHPSRLFYSEIGALGDQVQRYLDRFPREQILLIVFDDLKRAPLEVYRQVLRFAGVDDSFSPKMTVRNENRINRYAWLTRLRADPDAPLKLAVKRLLPRTAYNRLRGRLQAFNRQKGKRAPMDPDLRERLMRQFRPQVEALSRMTGRDLLDEWGYENARESEASARTDAVQV